MWCGVVVRCVVVVRRDGEAWCDVVERRDGEAWRGVVWCGGAT